MLWIWSEPGLDYMKSENFQSMNRIMNEKDEE